MVKFKSPRRMCEDCISLPQPLVACGQECCSSTAIYIYILQRYANIFSEVSQGFSVSRLNVPLSLFILNDHICTLSVIWKIQFGVCGVDEGLIDRDYC